MYFRIKFNRNAYVFALGHEHKKFAQSAWFSILKEYLTEDGECYYATILFSTGG